MGHAELLRWKAKQAEVVEPKINEVVEIQEPQEVVEVEVKKVELPEEIEVQEIKEAEVEVVEPQELGEEETPPIIKPFCDFCDAKGPIKHKGTCPTLKK